MPKTFLDRANALHRLHDSSDIRLLGWLLNAADQAKATGKRVDLAKEMESALSHWENKFAATPAHA